MIEYLRNTSDEAARADVVQRIAELAEQFAPDTTWFIDIMNQVRIIALLCLFLQTCWMIPSHILGYYLLLR